MSDMSKAVNNEIGPEDIIGPVAPGITLWEVSVSIKRMQGPVTDTFFVRARTYDGALLLAREVRLDVIDADAIRQDLGGTR